MQENAGQIDVCKSSQVKFWHFTMFMYLMLAGCGYSRRGCGLYSEKGEFLLIPAILRHDAFLFPHLFSNMVLINFVGDCRPKILEDKKNENNVFDLIQLSRPILIIYLY